VRFAKLHGAGNDFLVFDGRADPGLQATLPALVTRLCDRRRGIGADGALLLLPAGEGAARLLFWNRDGTLAPFCANGTRCAARFVAERWGWSEVTIHTGHAAVAAAVRGGEVTLRLPAPERVDDWRDLEAAGTVVRGRYLVVGVPHLVVPVDWADFGERALTPLAPALRAHRDLPPGGANVNFVRWPSPAPLAIRTWERGVEGETLACGSGAVAAALVAAAEGWAAPPVALLTASGRTLTVTPEATPPRCPLSLAGPAEWVFDGTLPQVPGPTKMP
jgi:diaminopimelate epimerase